MVLKKIAWILFLAFFLMGSVAWAQSFRDSKDPREKTRDRIQMIKMLKLTDTLKLDQEGTARFFAVNSQYEENKKRLRRDLHEELERLRHLMRDMAPQERELRETISRVKNRKREVDALAQRQMDDEMNLLRLDQQGRYILFQIDFRREMDDLIREVREEKPPRPGFEKAPERIR
jgi:hypothetical protein